ncbi:DUF2461 domain-containing protein [Nonlabens ulvanivorans]|uniref:DUF2461 domain-containing protein n=1 Tax=Nonlabens ulvanivorans TaxID=906888 RepID=UPI0029421CB0|nr:DUF2461 domain-containing protein [Nonlabens ulvanivorans]WOI23395.1 DUF2461 domain-containing protein [Nonlabens ulvanivorans]
MIHKELLTFLTSLEKNNNRPWFENHKPQFLELDNAFKNSINEITDLLNQHDVIEKSKTYRIYRDIRFSKDKTPFKVHRSANWMRAGVERRGSYYMRIKPGNHLIGVGFFGPEKEDLLRVRKELEVDAQELRDIIEEPQFLKTWGTFQGEQLKTAPRNFDKTHPDIDLIRFKSYHFLKSFTDHEIQSPEFFDNINKSFETARPFLDYMTDVLTTDLNGESLI